MLAVEINDEETALELLQLINESGLTVEGFDFISMWMEKATYCLESQKGEESFLACLFFSWIKVRQQPLNLVTGNASFLS